MATMTNFPIRVCYLIDWVGVGGTETQLLKTISLLDRSLIEPHLCLLYRDTAESRKVVLPDCPVLKLNVARLKRPGVVPKLLGFVKHLRNQRIQILQPYLPNSTYFGVLAGKLAKVPIVIRTRNNANHWMSLSDRLLGRALNRFVTVTLCNSEAARQAVLADESPNPHAVHLLPNGVDLDRFASLPTVTAERFNALAPRVGMVANLRPIKGVDVFLRACETIKKHEPGATFHVAGEGEERPRLEALAASLGLAESLQLHGQVADIPAFLSGLDVAVLSSRSEGTPNAVLEFMAAGRPIVATTVGDIPRILENGTDGLLVPPGDHERLSTQVLRLLRDPDLASELASHAREKAQTTYDRMSVVRRLQDYYVALCGATPLHLIDPSAGPSEAAITRPASPAHREALQVAASPGGKGAGETWSPPPH